LRASEKIGLGARATNDIIFISNALSQRDLPQQMVVHCKIDNNLQGFSNQERQEMRLMKFWPQQLCHKLTNLLMSNNIFN